MWTTDLPVVIVTSPDDLKAAMEAVPERIDDGELVTNVHVVTDGRYLSDPEWLLKPPPPKVGTAVAMNPRHVLVMPEEDASPFC